jgi:hypothetical protein
VRRGGDGAADLPQRLPAGPDVLRVRGQGSHGAWADDPDEPASSAAVLAAQPAELPQVTLHQGGELVGRAELSARSPQE